MKKYRIGAVRKLLNLSEDTLRYYESRGVVTPQKDEETGYRYYDAWDLNFLLDSIWYRGFDFSLKDVVKMIMLTSNALSADATGIIPFVIVSLGPIVNGLSPFAFVLAMIVISVILTNLLNNIPVAIILMSAAVPLAMQMGMNPFVIGVPIMFASGMAFALPSAFVPIGCCYAEPFGGPKYTIKYGAATMIVAIVVCGILMYPLSALVFGA